MNKMMKRTLKALFFVLVLMLPLLGNAEQAEATCYKPRPTINPIRVEDTVITGNVRAWDARCLNRIYYRTNPYKPWTSVKAGTNGSFINRDGSFGFKPSGGVGVPNTVYEIFLAYSNCFGYICGRTSTATARVIGPTITPNEFNINTDTEISGRYTGKLAEVYVNIDDLYEVKGVLNSNGTFSIAAVKGHISNVGQTVKVTGYTGPNKTGYAVTKYVKLAL